MNFQQLSLLQLFFQHIWLIFITLIFSIFWLFFSQQNKKHLHLNFIIVPNKLVLSCLLLSKFIIICFMGMGIILKLQIRMYLLNFWILLIIKFRIQIFQNIKILIWIFILYQSLCSLVFIRILYWAPYLRMLNDMRCVSILY